MSSDNRSIICDFIQYALFITATVTFTGYTENVSLPNPQGNQLAAGVQVEEWNMRSELIHEEHGERTYALVFDTGEEVVSGLVTFAGEYGLAGSHLTAIGAFSDVTLGYFEWDKKDYKKIRVDEQVEVLVLTGDIALGDMGPKLHAHVVIGKSDGTAHGGHLIEAHVRPTLEVVITESPVHLHRRFNRELNLALIEL
jgi:predicted DNA-binding protein with PD1-like motif